MWLFSRHGTRYPRNDPEPGGEDRAATGREMELDALTEQMPILRDAVIQNHKNGLGELCDKDLANLAAWTIDIPPELEEKLAPSGEEEMHDIGQRYTARLPGLLDNNYKDGDYVVCNWLNFILLIASIKYDSETNFHSFDIRRPAERKRVATISLKAFGETLKRPQLSTPTPSKTTLSFGYLGQYSYIKCSQINI